MARIPLGIRSGSLQRCSQKSFPTSHSRQWNPPRRGTNCLKVGEHSGSRDGPIDWGQCRVWPGLSRWPAWAVSGRFRLVCARPPTRCKCSNPAARLPYRWGETKSWCGSGNQCGGAVVLASLFVSRCHLMGRYRQESAIGSNRAEKGCYAMILQMRRADNKKHQSGTHGCCGEHSWRIHQSSGRFQLLLSQPI